MKTLLISVVTTFLLMLPLSETSLSKNSGPSANGDFQFLLEDGQLRYIDFNARKLNNGQIVGSMNFNDPSATSEDEGGPVGLFVSASFDCLQVHGNRAVMGGSIVNSNILSAIGRRILLVVEDNGEGVNIVSPDKLTWGVYQSETMDWIPKDAERDDDNGAQLVWLATDAERTDDVGIPSNRSKLIGCQSFPLSSYAFVDVLHGGGNIQVRP